jgi:hypothetical protein
MDAAKKKKVTNEGRIFKEQRIKYYIFTHYNEKLKNLVC